MFFYCFVIYIYIYSFSIAIAILACFAIPSLLLSFGHCYRWACTQMARLVCEVTALQL